MKRAQREKKDLSTDKLHEKLIWTVSADDPRLRGFSTDQ